MSNFQRKDAIERLWNTGMGPKRIARELDCSVEYVSYIVNLMSPAPYLSLVDEAGNHAKHLQLIGAANNGFGFPVCVKR